MKLGDWVFFFVHAFRNESSKSSPREKRYLEPLVREQTLAKPCQVEVIQFNEPLRVNLLFLLDRTKPDLQISTHQESWQNLNEIIEKLVRKYFALNLNQRELLLMFERCRNCDDKITFGIDFVKNLCTIYFTHDPRIKMSSPPLELNYFKPYDVAEMVFDRNLENSSSYFKDAS